MERNRSLHDQLEISHYAQFGVVTTAVVLETLKLGRQKNEFSQKILMNFGKLILIT